MLERADHGRVAVESEADVLTDRRRTDCLRIGVLFSIYLRLVAAAEPGMSSRFTSYLGFLVFPIPGENIGSDGVHASNCSCTLPSALRQQPTFR
jgi:hypothetical protein